MKKRWNFAQEPDQSVVKTLKNDLKVPTVIAKLLAQRNLFTFEEARNFFRPQLDNLHDPFLMEDMDKAVNRIAKSLNENEKILIYGDYDVDGTSAVALVYSFLKKHTDHIAFYQPDRYQEGYGISFEGIEYAHQQNIGLVIALDCGIKANEKIEKANGYGIDFIICDHHRPGEQLPSAYAILNPKKESCPYPFKELCGCGIGFKLTQAIAIHQQWDEKEVFDNLDLVAIATAADIVPLTGENRILTYYGLKALQKPLRKGIKLILELSGKQNVETVSDLVFTIAPRINAAGRMDSAHKAVELLLAKSENEAEEWSTLINQFNIERKELDKSITLEALHNIEQNINSSNKKSTVVYSDKWHKGVIGIVASRLIESHYKPTIVFTINNDMATGSARSVKGFDIHEAIEKCSHLIEKFGGHKYAAGLSVKKENLAAFAEVFENVVAESIPDELLVPEIKIDAQISFEDLIPDKTGSPLPKLYRLVEQFGPFGPGNMRPIFCLKDVSDQKGWSRIVGEDHLKISVTNPINRMQIDGIGFGMADKLEIVENQKNFNISFTLDKNNFNNRTSLQLLVRDIRSV